MPVQSDHTVLLHSSRLGGKAQFGGQRFGEMEVWALEALWCFKHLTGIAYSEIG